MNVLLVYMVNPQNQDQARAFLIEQKGRELSPESDWWRIETSLSFKHTFLQLWYWVGDGGFLRIVETGGDRQSFAYPTYKRSELFKSETIFQRLSAHGASIEDL